MVPGLEELLFEHDLRDQVLWSAVDQILHGQFAVATRDRQMCNFLAHLFGSLRTPLRVAKSVIVFGGVLV